MSNEGMLPVGDQEVKESEPASPVQVVEPGVVWPRINDSRQAQTSMYFLDGAKGPELPVVQGKEFREEFLEEGIYVSAIEVSPPVLKFELTWHPRPIAGIGKLVKQGPADEGNLP